MTASAARFLEQLAAAGDRFRYELQQREEGTVLSVADGVVRIRGLAGVGAEEVVIIGRGERSVAALALDLAPESVGAVMLDHPENVRAGDPVVATGAETRCAVGDALVGRVVDPLGRPLDRGPPIDAEPSSPVERDAPLLVERAAVREPLLTGWMAIDALLPIGRGQRQLILGDRGTGKTALAIDAVAHQRDQGVRCVYVSVGQPRSSVVTMVEHLRRVGGLEHTTVVVADADATAGMRYLAPFAGCSIAEEARDRGAHALVVFDDLSAHAVAYRELSLLLKRPPGREAYPGDIFYLHSRLLERATQLRPELGGGSLTALPIVETLAGRISSFIATNLISITDGQIYLDAGLFDRDVKPAIDIGLSVSRIGGRTQRPAMKQVAGKLRLDVAQFREAEPFSRFGARLEAGTRAVLDRGRRIQELLRQPPGRPLPHGEQVATLLALDAGIFDDEPLDDVAALAERLRARLRAANPALLAELDRGGRLEGSEREAVVARLRETR